MVTLCLMSTGSKIDNRKTAAESQEKTIEIQLQRLSLLTVGNGVKVQRPLFYSIMLCLQSLVQGQQCVQSCMPLKPYQVNDGIIIFGTAIVWDYFCS